MKWIFKTPVFGDMVRVRSGVFYHYGIYASDSEVIQFGLAPLQRPSEKDCDIKVCVTDFELFKNGGEYEVAELDDSEKESRRSPEDTVVYARVKLGTKGYNILHNNCEHFVHECVFGKKYCSLVEEIRASFKDTNS